MINKPIFFERNKVGRVYTGGLLFSDLFGDEKKDSYFPEEWICSNVKALNKNSLGEKEGISKVKDTDIYFDDLLKMHKDEMLGKGNNLRILVKALDSAIRLPCQAHPDKEFSKKHFNSPYGKTECWYILGTRENAKIYFGFKEGIGEEEFKKAIDDSEKGIDTFSDIMCSFEPKVGEVYLVRAKTVHAIGRGCLILEIQEPTDFTIQPERYCGEYKLSDEEMYIGLDKEDALKCFDFKKSEDPKIVPREFYNSNSAKMETLIGAKDTDCFVVNRITLKNGEIPFYVQSSYAIYVVTNGEGKIIGENYEKEIKKGDYFFMSACAIRNYKLTGTMEVIECY